MSMFKNYLKAGYPCLWMQTYEEERAVVSLSQEAGDGYYKYTWDLVRGLFDHETEQIRPYCQKYIDTKSRNLL